MKRTPRFYKWFFVFAITLGTILLLITQSNLPALSAPSPEDKVQHAWRNAQESGTYRFVTEVKQTVHLAPKLVNVGRTSRQDTLYMEGEADLPNRNLWMTLWQEGGSVTNHQDGIEVRFEGDHAYGRTVGSVWQEVEDISAAFAPESDPMAYLAGAKNVRELRVETRVLPSSDGSTADSATLTFTRYAFAMDGPAFASYLRDQLEHYLIQNGQLPAGLHLDSSNQYRGVVGDGEIWVDSRGLPLRLTVHLEYPQDRNGERVEAEIKTDFSNFAPLPAHRSMLTRITRTLGLSRTPHDRLATVTGMAFTGFLFLLLTQVHSKQVYTALALTVIFSMIVGPLLESQQVYAFSQRMASERAVYEQKQAEREASEEWTAGLLTSDWDPHANPLTAPRTTFDNASLDDASLEANLWTLPSAFSGREAFNLMPEGGNDGTEDSDGDGLIDAHEWRLGTFANNSDSDGDLISDYMEVYGFEMPGGEAPWYHEGEQRWYSDPLDADTNKDGLIDSQECPERVCFDLDGDGQLETGECPDLETPCRDTDGDHIPDMFDADNDNDGVSDRVDLSSDSVLGSRETPFTRDNPFKFVVNDLEPGRPVLVDLQLRPITATHLTYALNVLDWPEDTDGQVQHGKDTTFAGSDNPELKDTRDPNAANGDMRLIPMLEIEMTGGAIPLPMTSHVATRVELGGEITGTIHLSQQSADIRLDFDFADAQSYGVTLREGTCFRPGAELDAWANITDGATRTISDANLVDLADGEHALIATTGAREVCANLDNLINGPYEDQLVDLKALEPYGISVREKDRAGTLLAYVPLNVVTDETGGGRVAFAARMFYRLNSENWGNAQKLRVVWLLQMLSDACEPGTDKENCADHRMMDYVQVQHTYPEEWMLTGLSVREDHGMDVAILFEDPEGDADLTTDDWLWQASEGLGAAYIEGRDCDLIQDGVCVGNGRRDIAVAAGYGDTTIGERLHVTSTATITERWGIPYTATLHVEPLSFEHQDYIAHIMMTDTKRILNDTFTDGVTGTPKVAAPTLLFAIEKHARGAGLDGESWDGTRLTMGTDENTTSTLKWAPYRYTSGAGWEAYPMDDYWDLMEVSYKALFRRLYPDDDEDVTLGKMLVARSYYLSLYVGLNSLVQSGEDVLYEPTVGGGDSDDDLSIDSASAPVALIVDKVGGALKRSARRSQTQSALGESWKSLQQGFDKAVTWIDEEVFWRELGKSVGGSVKGCFSQGAFADVWRSGTAGKVGVAAAYAGAVVGVGLTITAIALDPTDASVAGNVLNGVGVLMEIHGAIEAWNDVLKASAKAAETGLKGLKGAMQAGKAIADESKKAASIGLVIAIAVTWGVAIAEICMSGGRGHAIGSAISAAIAGTIVAVIMFAIAAIPVVGWIIAAVIGVLDALTSLICGFLSEEQQEGLAGRWLCGGITGMITNVFQMMFYAGDVLVDLDDPDRFQLGGFDYTLATPDLGMSVGSQLDYTATVTNTLTFYPPLQGTPGENPDDLLKSSTFQYKWQTEETSLHEELSRSGMTGDWVPVGERFRIVKTVATDHAFGLVLAGINRPASLYLSEGYAVPVQNCVLFGICWISDEKDTKHTDIGQGIKYDVFPATLDGFYTAVQLDPAVDGYSLAWGQTGAVTFTRQQDFDGDGLRNQVDGGADPNDSRWDTDGDGLSDSYEDQIGTRNTLFDSDGDGLDDRQELILETDPLRADSDSDGLQDGEEVAGWEFVYSLDENGVPLRTWVTSDPLSPDGDGDTLTDFQEKTFGFHPRVWSDPQVLTFASEVHEAGAPGLLLRFEERTGSQLFGDLSGAARNGVCAGEGCPAAGVWGRYGNALLFDGVDDGVRVAHSVLNEAESGLTVAAWIKPAQLSGRQQIVATAQTASMDGFGFGTDGSGLVFSAFGVHDYVFPAAGLQTDTWVHVAVVMDGAHDVRFFVNGQFLGQADYYFPVNADRDDALLIGATTPLGSADLIEVFDGRIDEVVVFDRALSGAEVEMLMAARYNPDDLIVAPGDRLDYRAEITNELLNRSAQGLLSLNYPETLSSVVQPAPFVLPPQVGTVMSGTVQVSDTAPSGAANLTQVAGALITDWRESSDFAELWLKLDEGLGATTFQDSSGNLPARQGFCAGDACPIASDNAAVHFDGTNDYVTLPDATTLGLKESSFTASAWVKLSDTSGDRAILGADDGLRLIIRDAKPYMGFDADGLDSAFPLATDMWYHIVYRYNLDAQEQAIFVDGELKNRRTNAAAFQGDAEVTLGRALSDSYFAGYMDDVRIFARALSVEEIRTLYGRPVLEMAFEEDGSPFKDTASGEDLGRCSGAACPEAKEEGREGYSLDYAGKQHLSVTEGGALDLSDGHFTVGVWIYPSGADGYPQGIIGSQSGAGNDYPTLLRVGRKLRFGFSTGDALIDVNETGDVLTLNNWNHVALTCSGKEMMLYVNGIMAGSQMGPDDTWCARETGKAYIGRATDKGSVYLDRIYTHDEGDGAGYAEIEVMWNNARIKYEGGVDEGDTVWIQQTKTFGFGGDHVDVWEDDDYNDDHLIERQFNTNYSRTGAASDYGNKNWTKVTLYYNITNPSVPFQGMLDELVIYKRALPATEVDALYQSAFAAMRLRFDDPPGSTRFDNAADPSGANDGVCAGTTCPTSGVSGRDNQAVRFDGVDDAVSTALVIDPTDAAEGATLMAWVFPESASAGNHQVISSDDGGYEWSLLRQGGEWCVFTGAARYCFAGATVDVGQWQHIAAVFTPGSDTVTFYKNGAALGNTNLPNELSASGRAVAIGHNPGTREEFFDGRVDDARVIATTLSAANIEVYYRAAPQLQLHLDEETGATVFTDSSGNGNHGLSAGDSTSPTAGLKGQLGLALNFDGVDDVLTVGDAPALDVSSFTVGAWVQPYGEGMLTQTLLAKGGNYWLRIGPAENRIDFGLNAGGDCAFSQSYTSTGAFIPGSWNHVMLTYNDPNLRLYLNGSLDRSVNVSGGGCPNPEPLRVGGGEQPAYAALRGRVDEVTLYDHALSPLEVRDIFLYQGKWVEERQSYAINVDAEPPTSILRSDETYRLDQEVMLQVEARDDVSGVAQEEMGIKAPSQGDYSWASVPRCLDATGDTAWCPTFLPQGEGLYSLQFRGTDWVAQRETPTRTYAIYVDATPPDLSIGLPGDSLVGTVSHPTQKYAWVAPLGGIATDPLIQGVYPGSGVGSVWVTLFTPEGKIAGAGKQRATVADGLWSVLYALSDADPTNAYTVTVEAADNLGNSTRVSVSAVHMIRSAAGVMDNGSQMVALDARAPATRLTAVGANDTAIVQSAASAMVTETFDLDARAPATHLDQDSLPAIVTGTLPFSGTITDRAVPVVITWDTGADAAEAGLTIGCDTTTLYATAPGSLSDDRRYLWEHRLHRGAVCWVRLTDTAGDGGISGTVKICDSPVVTWQPDAYMSALEVPFTAVAPTCEPDLPVAGVGKVEVAFQPATPGSPFFNEIAPDGLVLHLPMDDGTDVNGVVNFQDISGLGHSGSCSGDGCPQVGVNGHGGRAADFDGVDDYVTVDAVASATSVAALSFGAWVYPSPGVERQEGLLGFHTSTGESHNQILYNTGVFQYYDGTAGWISSAGTFAPGQWYHVMVAIDAANNGTLYINSVPEANFTTSVRPDPSDLFSIGQEWDPGPVASHHFKGMIDDVRVFERALFAGEVRDLHLGAGPVLALPFDEGVLAGGNSLVDDSGWGHNGTLESGADDPAIKTVPGKVGPYALIFDGVDDVAFVPGSSALDLDSFSVGAWIMPTQTGADQTLIVKGVGGMNYGMMLTAAGQARFEMYADDCATAHQMISNGAVTWTEWNHVMMTFDGERLTGYLNGSETISSSVSLAGLCHNDAPVQIGPLAAQVDDVRVYPRALHAAEVYALTQSAWRAAEPLPQGVDATTWQAQAPDGLEGGYQLNVRGWDWAEHPDNSSQSQGVWRGEVDTAEPRVRLTRQMLDGVTDLYTAEAWDFSLTEANFVSPCGDALGAEHEMYQSPWYLTLGAAERLNYLTASCTVPAAHELSPVGADETQVPDTVIVSDTYAYVNYNVSELVRIMDVADPENPVEVGVYAGSFSDMAISGNILYLVDPSGGYGYGGLIVLDVSDPTNPNQIGRYYNTSGNYCYAIAIDEPYAYLDCGSLVVVDVSTPSNPQLVKDYYLEVSIWHVDTAGDYVYLAAGASGLMIVDVHDPSNPFVAGQYATTNTASHVTVHDNIAYLSVRMPLGLWDETRLHIIDVGDPANPQALSDYRTPGYGGAVITEVGTRTYAYVNGGYWGMRVWDVSDPANPVPVGFVDEPAWIKITWKAYTRDVAVAGNYVYVVYSEIGLRIYPLYDSGAGELMTACDAYGHCVTAEAQAGALGPGVFIHTIPTPPDSSPNVVRIWPEVHALLPPTLLQALAALPEAEARMHLDSLQAIHAMRALTVTVDATSVYTETWADGELMGVALRYIDWTPASDGSDDGPHVIRATVANWDNPPAFYSDTVTVTVDTQPPAITIAPGTITSTAYYPPGMIELHGTVTDLAGVAGVQVIITDTAEPLTDIEVEATITGETWRALWPVDAWNTPDGLRQYYLTAKATDIGGNASYAYDIVYPDVSPPSPVTMTLQAGGDVLRPGDTVRALPATLTLAWNASHDGSGVSRYLVNWTARADSVLTSSLHTLDPFTLSDGFVVGEAFKVMVELASQDIYNNTRWQSFGSVYVDGPLTPDYVLLEEENTYRGWMQSGCSLVGVDRRVARHAQSRASLSILQKFYTTWDDRGLRLAWTGANWSNDGDLFVYLDTAPGGTVTAYMPYSASPGDTQIYLPGVTPFTTLDGMAADYLVWVRDSETAELLHWNGGEWIVAATLEPEHYRFDPALNQGQIDLYLSFAQLGISDPLASALDMVAFASEEQELRLWATMPPVNPVNSERVVRTAAYATTGDSFALLHRYHWPSLGPGVCPNGTSGTQLSSPQAQPLMPTQGGSNADVDLELNLSVEPVGLVYSFLGDGLFWLWETLFGDRSGDASSLFTFVDVDHPPLGDGEEVAFTLYYHNLGTAPATAVQVDVSTRYALRLPEGQHKVIDLGDVAPGEAGSLTFYADVDAEGAYLQCLGTAPESTCAAYLRLATLAAAVYDDVHPPSGPALDWLWADFRVDSQEPLFYGIQSPELLVSAGSNTVRGYAYDNTGVPTVTMEIQRPSGGSAILVCPDTTPMDGRWSCSWDVTASNGGTVPNDGDTFAVRLGTVDGVGQAAVLSTTQNFIVDSAPPVVTLDPEASDVTASGALLRGGTFTLVGDIVDNRALGTVEVCVDDDCEPADMALNPGRVTRVYDDIPDPPIAIGAATPCDGGELVRSFVVTESFDVGTVSVGFNAPHSHRDDLLVTLTSPAGTQVRLLFSDEITETNDAHYDVLLNDAAADTYSARRDDDPTAPYYDRLARPYAPLQAFHDEEASGTWTLSICDVRPSEDDGLYQRARLILKPRDTSAHTGRWSYTVVSTDEADSVEKSIAVYGEDMVGNRIAEPLWLTVTLDNIGPAVTILTATDRLPLSVNSIVMTGTATDGGRVSDVFVYVQTPSGRLYTERIDNVTPSRYVSLSASQASATVQWTYNLEPNQVGTYTLWINAVDVAGNGTTTDPLQVAALPVYEPSYLYLPLILRSDFQAPELLLADGNLSATEVELVVANVGRTSVIHGFRVDMYFNPDPIPSGPNQTWQNLAPYGGYWLVAGSALPLQPGELITLTLNDAYYQAAGSHYPPQWAAVTSYYVQVDTLNEVVEIQELTDAYYDNISGEVIAPNLP